MRLWQLQDVLKITRKLTIAKNALLEFEGGVKDRVVSLTGATTLTETQSGSQLVLNLAGGFTTTLPKPKSGLKYRFTVGINPTTSYYVVTDGGDNIFYGSIQESETDSTEDGPTAAGADSIEFTAAAAVPGDYVEVWSDGTNWYIDGMTAADGGIAIATT